MCGGGRDCPSERTLLEYIFAGRIFPDSAEFLYIVGIYFRGDVSLRMRFQYQMFTRTHDKFPEGQAGEGGGGGDRKLN